MRRLIISAVALAFAAHAFGQDLNPTVVVTNTYEGSASAITKPDRVMNVPDSVMKFNLNFDYSVFDKPYQGAYEFHPYLVVMKPKGDPSDRSSLYFKAGAGYTFRPEATLVWSPLLGKGFSLNVHADHSSYFGLYHSIEGAKGDDDLFHALPSGDSYKGHDMTNTAGVDLGYAWGGGNASVSVDYLGVHAKGQSTELNMNGLQAVLKASSNNSQARGFFYDASLRGRFFQDESRVSLRASAGHSLGSSSRIAADALLDWAKMKVGSASTEVLSADPSAFLLSATPKYQFLYGRFQLSAGVCVSIPFYYAPESFSFRRGQIIYPDLHARIGLIDERLAAFASVTGGNTLNSSADIRMMRHFAYMPYAENAIGITSERLNAKLGIEGNILSMLQFSLCGGYSILSGGLLDYAVTAYTPLSCLKAVDYGYWFADLKYDFKRMGIEVDGSLGLRYAPGISEELVLSPSLLSGTTRALYNWKGRLKAGLVTDYSMKRVATFGDSTLDVPGFFDLGLVGEFSFTPNIGAWLRAGNLLGQAIQRTPFIAEKGRWVTGGINLKF